MKVLYINVVLLRRCTHVRHLQLNQQEKYWRALRALLLQAQQLNDERMIDNPYLTAASMLSIEGQGC
jgi:hypothetical protein